MRRPCFAVTRNGLPITEHPLSETVETGVRYNVVLGGLVPEMEEREASVFAQYTWDRWLALSWQERANAIAHFRLHHLIDLHRNDAVSSEMKRRTSQAGR